MMTRPDLILNLEESKWVQATRLMETLGRFCLLKLSVLRLPLIGLRILMSVEWISLAV